MQNRLVDVAFEISRRHTKLHPFAKQLMGMVRRTYACKQIVRWKCVLHQY